MNSDLMYGLNYIRKQKDAILRAITYPTQDEKEAWVIEHTLNMLLGGSQFNLGTDEVDGQLYICVTHRVGDHFYVLDHASYRIKGT